MKKIIALAPLSLVLAACASGPVHQEPAAMPYNQATAPTTSKAYDRMMPEIFTCEDDGIVQAKYSLDGEQAMITASLPEVQWDNQTAYLDIARSGSGSRYVNDVNPKVTYQWQNKGDTGIMSINWADDGTEYSVTCNRK